MSRTVPLEAICDRLDYGLTASANPAAEGPKFLRITDLQDDRIEWADVPRAECPPKKFRKYAIEPGDLFFARTGATTGKCYLVDAVAEPSVFASYLIRLRPSERADSRYLAHYFRSDKYWAQIGQMSVGAAQPGVNASKLKKLQIPLPPLAEQKRIAKILDAADALRAKRRESLTLLDQLLQSTFLEMFGDPVENPMGWEVGQIGDCLETATYGTSKKASETRGEFPVLRMNNITYLGSWNFSSLKYVDLDEKEKKKHLVHAGEVLFNRTNSKELVGKTAVYRKKDPMAYAGYLVKGTPNGRANGEYIAAFMNTPYVKCLLRNMCKNIVGMANINAKEFQKIPIPIPPISEQYEYAEIVKEALDHRKQRHCQIEELDRLFGSLQASAFAEELGRRAI